MVLDPWLPVGFLLPGGTTSRALLFESAAWQILETSGGGRALIVREELGQRWIGSGLLEEGALMPFQFGPMQLRCLSSDLTQVLCPISGGNAPASKSEALAFALALKASREIDPTSPLQDALYVEKFSRLVPTYSISSRTEDEIVLGFWLTGGAPVSVSGFRRLHQMLSWWSAPNLKQVIEAAGFEVAEIISLERPSDQQAPEAGGPSVEERDSQASDDATARAFELPGRPALASFFNDHVVEIIQNRERYRALGIGFPSPIVLYGPPGTGKTFAVERLVDFLGWPSFQIDASSIASPFIHETSRKVAEIFEKARESAPAVLVIDEMDAFLADRDVGTGHHRVEEVAEFLRRIPEATKNEVLVVAMTNRIDLIDSAVLRRGRFDHLIHIDYASESEVLSLLERLLAGLPKEGNVDAAPLAKQLSGRPLSDVTFVVREGARLAAHAGKERLDHESLITALSSTPAREREGGQQRRIGFI